MRIMISRLRKRIFMATVVAAMLGAIVSVVAAETVDPANDNSQFAWGENVGWINAEPSGNGGPGVTVSGSKLTGYMYGENIGWINLNCTNNATCASTGSYGVTNDGRGKLAGYAWGENIGWISFSCANTPATCATTGNYGVTIDPATGLFSGKAYGENIGWVVFDYTTSAATRIKTDDGDGIAGATDNCPFDANADQKNTDNAPLVTAGAPNDVTVANSDLLGDVCDPDIDNDGLANALEGSIGPAGANHALCLSATGNTDPLKSDTDGDRVLDGAECALGSDPTNAASKPALPTAANDPDRDGLSTSFELSIGSDPTKADTDGDGIPDGVEYKGYNTSPTVVDTDGDGCPDGREIASLDGNTLVNSLDLLLIANRFNRRDLPVQDVNKDGVINSTDLALTARNFNGTPC